MNTLLTEFRDATRDMLTVWDGVAHPALAYSPGSPAARLRDLVNTPDPVEPCPSPAADRKHASALDVANAIVSLWGVMNELDWPGSLPEDERISCGNPFSVKPSSARDDDPSVVFWSDLPGNRQGCAIVLDCGIWISTTWAQESES